MARTKVTVRTIAKKKADGARIVCLTAYDFTSAQIADEAGVDLILVGDSLGNVIMGDQTTLGVSLEAMEHHIRAVRKGVVNALLVGDLPFGSYQSSPQQAIDSSVRLMKAGAEAVKLEGDYPETVQLLLKAGIPVMGHIGYTPQSFHKFGGARVQGRGEQGAEEIEVAKSLDKAGCFGIVLELMPTELASKITGSVKCATIGIGAGLQCDGEIQVWHDVLGLSAQSFKHAKAFTNARAIFRSALSAYADAVREKQFPGPENEA